MKKNLPFYSLIFVVLCTIKTQAQQQGQYSQYMLNYFLINPAVGGTEDFTDLRAGYRQQWTGMTGAPQNYYLTVHTPLNKIHGRHDKKFGNKKDRPHHFIGGMLNGQRMGAFAQNSAYFSYGYYLPLTRKWALSMAASAGVVQQTLNQNKLDFGDEQADPAVNYAKGFSPDMNLGIWLSSKKFFGGISSYQLFDNKIGNQGENTLNRHFYLTTGYSINLNRDWTIVPSLLLKAVPSTAYQLDLNVKIKYQKLAWAGISYRRSDAVVLLVGTTLFNTLELGYSYDFTTSKLSGYSKGSHEVMLGIKFANKAKVISPSDFW